MADLDKRPSVREKATAEFDELLQDVNSLLEDGECTPTRLRGLEEGECTPTKLDLDDDSFDFDLDGDLKDGDDENSEHEITGILSNFLRVCAYGSSRESRLKNNEDPCGSHHC